MESIPTSPFYTTAEFAALFKRRPRSTLATWRKAGNVYGIVPTKIGERVMWPKDQVQRVLTGMSAEPPVREVVFSTIRADLFTQLVWEEGGYNLILRGPLANLGQIIKYVGLQEVMENTLGAA